MNKKIYVWIPSYDWKVDTNVMFWIRGQRLPEWYELVFNSHSIVSGLMVHSARNQIVKKFLTSGCDYLWFCDDDNPPSSDVLKYLIAADKDACSALVPLRHWRWDTVNITLNWTGVTSIINLPNLFEIENFWTGCVLMKKKLVQDVFTETKWYPYQFWMVDCAFGKDGKGKEIYREDHKDEYLQIDWVVQLMPWEVWEDLNFGNMAKKLWYKFYADKRAKCLHRNDQIGYLSVKNV
jgi:hypothetical protein